MNVPCRECGAPQEALCVDPNGQPAYTHLARMNDEIMFLRDPTVIRMIGELIDSKLGRT